MPITIDHPGVYVQEAPVATGSADVPTAIAAFVGRTGDGPVGEPATVFDLAGYERVFGASTASLGVQVAAFFANGGGQAVIVRSADPLSEQAWLDAIGALGDGPSFNILCIPPDAVAGDPPPAVVREAAACCVARRAMLILDPPAAWRQAFEAGRLTAIAPADLGLQDLDQARNAAVYFPRIVIPDPTDPTANRTVPGSGAIAGVWARTDAERGVWKAPAGLNATIVGVTGLAADLTDSDSGLLNPLGVNALRTFPQAGAVVWGARTLAGADRLADDYRYIPVRRLALYIESWLVQSLQWAVFEPNDPRLWAAVRRQAATFMDGLWRQGALTGATSGEAWFVTCDATTTTPTDIDSGVFGVMVGFAPIKPAEFVIVTVRHMAGQSS